MVGAALLSKSNWTGEPTTREVVADQHWIGAALATLRRLGISVVDDKELFMQNDRLRSLTAIIEHLELAATGNHQRFHSSTWRQRLLSVPRRKANRENTAKRKTPIKMPHLQSSPVAEVHVYEVVGV